MKEVSGEMKNSLLPVENFSLFDSMAGIEIMDQKMDIKMDLENMDTLEKMIDQKQIKNPKDLTQEEMI